VPNALQSRLRARVLRLQVQRAPQLLLRVAMSPTRTAQMLGLPNNIVREVWPQLQRPLPQPLHLAVVAPARLL
jgi:hypothetical protein